MNAHLQLSRTFLLLAHANYIIPIMNFDAQGELSLKSLCNSPLQPPLPSEIGYYFKITAFQSPPFFGLNSFNGYIFKTMLKTF